MDDVIRAEGLTKSFRGKQVLSDVSFGIGPRQVFGCLGPNGAGKTTIIRLILGLLEPDRGSVRVLGREAGGNRRDVNRRIGFMLHDPGLYDELSCRQNLEYYADIYGVAKERIEQLLGELGLRDVRDETVDHFSRGMKQKVVLARALLHDPDILVLDEPATGLDPEMQVWMRDYIRELARGGKTILFSSHNLFEVQQVCSHIGVIYGGRLIRSGSVGELRKKLAAAAVEIEVSDARGLAGRDGALFNGQYGIEGNKITLFPAKEEDVQAGIRRLAELNYQIVNISRKEQSVEEMYIELIEEARR